MVLINDSLVRTTPFDRERCQLAINWLDEMLGEGLHETSSDLIVALDLISEMRGMIKYGNAPRVDRRIL